jgi:hypothetical protein
MISILRQSARQAFQTEDLGLDRRRARSWPRPDQRQVHDRAIAIIRWRMPPLNNADTGNRRSGSNTRA